LTATFFSALDRNEYNHITATYFLLAERKLRAQRQMAAKKLKSNEDKQVSQNRFISFLGWGCTQNNCFFMRIKLYALIRVGVSLPGFMEYCAGLNKATYH
jgi:hypothetical protein